MLRSTGWTDKATIKARIEEVLGLVGMNEKTDKMPHELSGGEQQRIAIARAMLNEPRLIVADEPTGNLDPETAANIIGLLNDISMKGTAVVMSTHNIDMLNRFPGIIYRCKDGVLTDVTRKYPQLDLAEDGKEEQ